MLTITVLLHGSTCAECAPRAKFRQVALVKCILPVTSLDEYHYTSKPLRKGHTLALSTPCSVMPPVELLRANFFGRGSDGGAKSVANFAASDSGSGGENPPRYPDLISMS